jgi:hypothetical protein
MIGKAIRQILIADSIVAAITTRCYPSTLPQDPVYPLILYMRVTGPREHSLQGAVGMATPRFQVEAWAETYAAAKALAAAIRGALDNYRGTAASVRIGSCLIIGEWDTYEPEVNCHRIIMDFSIIHDET